MSISLAHTLNLAATGILVGNEFATWAVVHRAVRALPVSSQVIAEQAMTRRYLALMPVLMTATIASGVAVLVLLPAGEPAAFRLTLAGTTCFAVMLAITLVGNMPLNAATLRATADIPEGDWRRLRRRWDALHSVRILLDVSGYLLLVVGLVART